MKIQARSANAQNLLPGTQVYQQLNNDLTIFLRPWGTAEFNQKVVDEITHYLSTTQADIEVTTPFDYMESLSSLANRTRIALLLAHDLLYKTDNRSEYSVGFECFILFRNKKEIAYAGVGRFSLGKFKEHSLNTILSMGSDLDDESLLPVQMIGVEKDIAVCAGSVSYDEQNEYVLSSPFRCEIKINESGMGAGKVEFWPSNSTYWYSIISA
jgi:hypothetical protein